MSVEVVAVRWECFVCDATAITAPDRLPAGWLELEAPSWRASHPPRHYCQEHAGEGRSLRRRRRGAVGERSFEVSREEYRRVEGLLGDALHALRVLKIGSQ